MKGECIDQEFHTAWLLFKNSSLYQHFEIGFPIKFLSFGRFSDYCMLKVIFW